ncbi:unnamed protein product [Schistosoma margrebowiei]|uniref:Trafficking protein particle complex subunit 11 n=1 Tax=Schistosoma margrebowiei TaxID=48269 RepID=A0AA84ZPM6_9TREM|nr:unnamed protein product [Schistosoma margrebowiei]
MEYIDKLPDELCCKPKPLIVFSGLDTERNQVHRSIWRAFNTSKSHDRDSFKFRCKSVDHQFPKPKYKQLASYEWLMPKGILKTGWMKKHLEEIPAFVALFYDLDWDEPQWGERSTECAQMVATVRSKLAGRESKLVVILIQKRAPLPLGEDLNAMDRAQSLCNKCDLPGKNLFVLSHTNLLYGCITRLEDEFRDMAANYYHNQAKKVKAHKDSLNKTSHQLLFVRHEFKIAFYAELKQDPGLALKHYQQAYNHLTELRMLDAHLLEVKTVAGFINYKICRLSFQNNASDAISQFRRHINFFANLVGLPQLAFEHEAWMSKQFEILGDLFQEAIKSSLTPLITQHPGLYYQEASRHAVCRRQLCQALCIPTVKAAEMNADDRLYYPLSTESNESTLGIDAAFAIDSGLFAEESESSPHLPNHSLECSKSKRTAINTAVEFVRAQSPLLFKKQIFTADSPNLSGYHSPSQVPAVDCLSATEKINGLEFYGQRPWRQGIQSIEPPNPTKEREGILSLQKEELKVDHSSFIIPLLEQTRLQYKRYKAERMKLYPCILMGSEYYDKQDYDKALSCYLSVINEYRTEKWWSLYTFTLKRIATCAYLIAQPTVFLSSCLELLGPNSLVPLCEKVQVQQAIFDFLKTGVPNLIMFSPELDHTIKTIEDGWKKQLDLLIQHTSNTHSDVAHNESVNENKVDIEKKPQSSTDSHFDEKYRISLDITRINTCIQCKACFSQPAYTFGQPVQLAVFLRSFAPLPILIHHVTVNFSNKVECPTSSLNTPPSTINKPLIGNFSTHQTSQTWSSKFILDSKEKFKVILLCLNPDVLGNQIKVDSIHLCLSPSMVNCHKDIIDELILCTVSWQWNTKSDYHPYVSGRKTIGHKHHNLKKQHDVLHDNVNTISNNNCGLWCKEVVLSVPERRMQKNPIKIESNGFIINHGFPNLPPDWDIIDSRIRTEMHHPSSGLEITMPENVCILANEISQIKLTIRNPTQSDCTKLNLTVRLIPKEKDSTEFPDNASNTSTTVSTTTMITNPTVIDNYIIVGSSSELISHISAKNNNSSQKSSSAYFIKKLDDIPSNQSISVTISLCCSSPSLVSNNNQTLSCYLTFSTKLLPCEYPDYLLSLSDSLTTETTLVYNVIHESVKLSNNIELSNINNNLVQNIMDQNAMVIQCTQNIETNITILSPFELDYKLLSLTQHPIKSLIVNDEFLLLFKLTNTADCELEIHNIQLEVANEISCGSDSHNTCIKNLIMQSSESCTECHMLLLTETMNSLETINLGYITVHWSRVSTHDDDNMKPYIETTKFTLPTIPVLSLPIQISAELPAYGVMLTPFPITFILSNKTIYPQEAVFQLESIHGFMFSGQQKLKLRLLPDSPHYLNYTLLPLVSGNLKLPRLHVMLERYATLTSNTQNDQPDIHIQLEENLLRQVPTHLIVIPSTDGLFESSEKNPIFNQEEIKNV